jgi:hypothetical protein
VADRGKGVAEETHLGEDAGDGAPTAPHATPPEKRAGFWKASGPERFWDRRRIRYVLAGAVLLSGAAHYAAVPFSLLPQEKFEVREVEGETSIPIDMLEDTPPPPEPPPAPEKPPEENAEGDKAHAGLRDAGADAPHDAAPDAKKKDADLEGDAEVALMEDASASSLADAAVASREDGGVPGANGPRDPTALVGAAGNAQAGPALVQLLVNMAEIRKNPVGTRLGPLLSAIPQWDDFMQGTNVDPVRDTDWVLITGPSLIHTERDVILVHYSASDALVDHAIQIVSKKYDRGGPFDAGVPGVKAALGHADRAPRVFLRPQTHVLAVVPPDFANTAARTLKGAHISAHVRPGEAMRLVLKTPSRPFPAIPASISEMRLWIVPRPDGGADVFGEGDTPDAAACSAAVAQLRKVIRTQNSIMVRMVTGGLLDTVDITEDGSTVRLRAPVTPEQLETILNLVSSQLGVTLPPGPGTRPR